MKIILTYSLIFIAQISLLGQDFDLNKDLFLHDYASFQKGNIYLGPTLWLTIKNDLTIEKGSITFMVPDETGVNQKKEGKLIQKKSDYTDFFNYILNFYPENETIIRPPTSLEQNYFDQILFYKEQTKTFVIESSKISLIADFDINGRLIFLEKL